MDIDRIGAQVTVRVDNTELSELGLDFESLKDRDISAKIFLAALRAQLMSRFNVEISGDIRVIKRNYGVRLELTLCLNAEFFDDPEKAYKSLKYGDNGGELYILDDVYTIVPEGCDEVAAAKIKEHGRFLCHAPRKNIQT
ncbi:hypothetical protein SAMN02910406_02036 [Ruminococcus albus]|uniref:Uncharacterized protein n=2 Tax=Ruminococcus albus TaxID=1264 RepID=A0A1I1KJR1_RUMAL|nr:hypothetical protein SAMN02910406_02036 [Ruminococcus albus]